MTKDNPSDPRLYDVRNIERNIKRGLLTRKDYEKHLKSLSDSKDKAAAPVDDAKKSGE
jgi:hypothetical protein